VNGTLYLDPDKLPPAAALPLMVAAYRQKHGRDAKLVAMRPDAAATLPERVGDVSVVGDKYRQAHEYWVAG
jgi:hypothetical protein